MGKLHQQAEIDRLNSVLDFRVRALRLAEQERDLAQAERDAAQWQADAAQFEIDRLTTALAESERKRVEAEADLADAQAQRDILIRTNADLAAGWVEDITPTQENPDDQG